MCLQKEKVYDAVDQLCINEKLWFDMIIANNYKLLEGLEKCVKILLFNEVYKTCH